MSIKNDGQLSPRVLANRRNGALGGKARARNNSKEQMASWSSKGGTTTSFVYGSDFAKFRASKRKTVGRYGTPIEDTVYAKSRKAKKPR